MTAEDLDTFHKSLNRCTADEQFLERFYWLFMASSPDVREKFARTNWLRQKRMLVASFHMMMVAQEHGTEGNEHLHRVAALHGAHGRDIPEHLYDIWLNCLLRAVREYDAEYTDEIGDIWTKMMQNGIAFMKRRRNDPIPPTDD
jgi:hemoglobin-like flavoprotein